MTLEQNVVPLDRLLLLEPVETLEPKMASFTLVVMPGTAPFMQVVIIGTALFSLVVMPGTALFLLVVMPGTAPFMQVATPKFLTDLLNAISRFGSASERKKKKL